MTDEFPVCPNCSSIDSLRNITAQFPQVWKQAEIQEAENTFVYCVICKRMINRKETKIQEVGKNDF